jgi:hypothetical protein
MDQPLSQTFTESLNHSLLNFNVLYTSFDITDGTTALAE